MDHKRWLTTYIWDVVDACIPVVNHLRDLGSSLSITSAIDTSMFVRSCAHPRGLHACEATHVDEGSLRKYTSLVSK
eukprot:740989-Karenia_brevis.AAC.1